MKKILIVISKDAIRRNILDTDFLKLLRKKNQNLKFIIVVECDKLEYYQNKYNFVNTEFVGYCRKGHRRLHSIIFFLVRNGIYSHSTKMYRMRARELGTAGFLQTLFKEVLASTLGKVDLYKKIVRYLVQKLRWAEVSKIYDEVKPDYVFAPSLIDNDFDVPFAVEGKCRKLRVIGMVRSWDNLNNHGLLAFVPDVFILQNDWLYEAGRRFQALSKNLPIFFIGVPHYDQYVNLDKKIIKKEIFFKQMGLDINKKLILLGGGDFYYTEDKLPQTLNNLIENKKIKFPTQILFRPHPSTMFTLEEYNLGNLSNVVLNNAFSNKKLKFTDEDTLINILYYSDIIMNIASTLSIDAAIFDTPAICIGFDDVGKPQPYWLSVLRLYDSFDHYEKLVATNGVRVSKKVDELAKDINEYLEFPNKDSDGRKKIVETFVGKFDGKSVIRLVDVISNCIK